MQNVVRQLLKKDFVLRSWNTPWHCSVVVCGMLIANIDMNICCLKYYLLTKHSCIYFIAFMINELSYGLFCDLSHEK